MSDATANYPLGQKITDAYGATQLGTETWFPDIDYSSTSHPKGVRQTPIETHCVLVKNTSGGNLAVGAMVKWKAAKAGTEIGAVAGADEQACGQVDPYLSSVVANNETFWLIRSGIGKVNSSAAVTAGDAIGTAASGKVKTSAKSSVALLVGSCGIALETAAGADVVIRALLDCKNT
jgi:hypothetical protein